MSAVSEEGTSGNSVLYFNVSDIQEDYESLKSKGVECFQEPHIIHSTHNYELWIAFFKDPEGNTMAVMDERGTLTE